MTIQTKITKMMVDPESKKYVVIVKATILSNLNTVEAYGSQEYTSASGISGAIELAEDKAVDRAITFLELKAKDKK